MTNETANRRTPQRAVLRVPDPVFPHKTPAGRRSGSCPAPLLAAGGQSDPNPQAEDSTGVTSGGHESNAPGPEGQSVSALMPSPPVISADAAARVLCDYFLANAERGDNAANDEFVTELTLRMRTGQARSVGVNFPRATETTPVVPHRGVR